MGGIILKLPVGQLNYKRHGVFSDIHLSTCESSLFSNPLSFAVIFELPGSPPACRGSLGAHFEITDLVLGGKYFKTFLHS